MPNTLNLSPKLIDHTDTIQNYLVGLNQTKKELELVHDKLEHMLQELDTTLAKLATEWAKQREKYCHTLVQQLQEQGITLTSEEKDSLRLNSITVPNLAATRDSLKQLNIKLPQQASAFTVVACSVVAAALSRNLQKPEAAYQIIKGLQAIKEENTDAEEFKLRCGQLLQGMTKNALQLKEQAKVAVNAFTHQQTSIEQLIHSDIGATKKATIESALQETHTL